MRRQLQGMFCVLKSNAEYDQECLKQSRIFLWEMRLVNASQNCKKSGFVLFCFVSPYHFSLVFLSLFIVLDMLISSERRNYVFLLIDSF